MCLNLHSCILKEGATMPDAMPEGVIAGGWNFVIAAYSITAVGLGAYVWSLRVRLRRLRHLLKRN